VSFRKDQVKEDEMGKEFSTHEKMNAYRVFVGEAEGKRPPRRPRCRWENNIQMDLTEIGCDCTDWINLAQVRDWWGPLVNTVMSLRVPQTAGKFLSS
jgi:hypothetical protein